MGKVKESKGAKATNPLATVKNGGITKPSQTPKAKAKVVAQATAKAIKNKKLEVDSDASSDESDDEIESGSDADSDSGSEAESDSSDGSSASDDDSEEETKAVKPAKPATNGKVNGASHADSDDSESDSEVEAKPKANGANTNGAAAADSDSSDSSDSSSDEAEKKTKKTKKTAPAAHAVNGKSKKEADSSDEDDADSADSEDDSDESGSSDSSGSDSDAESESPKTPAKPQQEEAPKKRKFEAADDDALPKKAKVDSSGDESSTIFVGRLSWGVDDDMLYEAFKEFDGLLSARVVTHKDSGRSRGFGYVDFSAHAAAKTALDAMQGQEIDGRPINLDLAKGRNNNTDSPQARVQERAKRHGDVISPPSDTLFVGNIPFDATQDDVIEFFSDTAEVVSVRLPTDQESGRPKGFGYVSFNSVEDAQRVFQAKSGASMGPGRAGRVVRLDYASQRPPRDGFSGGGRGGRGGGRGGRGDARGGRGGRGGGRGSFGGGRGGFRISNDGGAPSSNKIRFDD